MGMRDLFYFCLIGLTMSGISTSGRAQTPATSESIENLSELGSTNATLHEIAYIKPSNTGAGDQFGTGGTSFIQTLPEGRPPAGTKRDATR